VVTVVPRTGWTCRPVARTISWATALIFCSLAAVSPAAPATRTRIAPTGAALAAPA
jgi:hypothetical protein